MANECQPPTAADYVITALSPALIMGLVGSLAFFLLEIGYQGQYTGRLAYTLFFFVFGAVLVSRIAITLDGNRAWLYGLALGGAVFLAMTKYMEYPPGSSLAVFGWMINLGIIGVVLWSANKLTWDCTYVDEKQEDAGRGLMTEVSRRLAATSGSSVAGLCEAGPRDHSSHGPASQRPATEAEERKRKPIGLWVVYYSLAALPLFGLGQALIPAADAGRRVYVFWLMVLYVGSGLGLLLTTCLLSIRRYLRQRRQSMPPAMTAVWVGTGAALIVAFLIAGALLPRPLGEYQLVSFKPLGSRDRDASQQAMRSNGAGKGEGDPGAKDKDESKDAKDGSGGQGQIGGRESGKTGKGEAGAKGGNSKDGKGDSKADGGKKSGGDSRNKGDDGQRSNQQTSSSTQSAPPAPSASLSGLSNVLKWIVLAVFVVLIVGFVGWFVLKNLSSAHRWARDLLNALAAFWQSLFGGKRTETIEAEEETAAEIVEKPRPFEDFRNPFADGTAAGQSPEALVRYSFAALEAWAYEQDLSRRDDETPLEFAHRLGEAVPRVEDETRQLAGLYVRMAYARRRLPESCRPTVEQFWRRLDSAAAPANVRPP
jgi:hypothetical protein